MIVIPLWAVFLIASVALLVIYAIIDHYIVTPFRAFILNQKLFKYTKIPAHGPLIERFKWCKSKDEAKQHYVHFEFLECIYPRKFSEKIRPSS